ncbi:MAG TPA: NrfD/PsrC family molybdoenzyme membrane anchor subunit [Candidatus Dormibacteraeota bacterium]
MAVATGFQRRRGRRRGEAEVVPPPQFTSYYGRPILKKPTWAALDIAGYFFLGGLAGASSGLAAGAELTGRPGLARASKVGALGAASLALVGLIHDLGKPSRFLNMLRVFKPTSPMSVGSWLLAAYGPAAGVAAVTSVTGTFPRTGRAATLAAAAVGSGVAAYTAALISDTAVPAWHGGYREMPFVFVGSAASAAGGLGLLTSSDRESAPARRLAAWGAVLELSSLRLMEHRLGSAAEPMRQGSGGRLLKAAEVLTVAGALSTALPGRRRRLWAGLGGAALLAGSACTRFGIFEAGVASAEDPKYTVVPQRERLSQREQAGAVPG